MKKGYGGSVLSSMTKARPEEEAGFLVRRGELF
jgi:hypothetical protein